MTVRELIKIIDDNQYAIFIEDFTIAKQLLINELPTHSSVINGCNSWRELYNEFLRFKPYMEMVETSVGQYRCIPDPTLIIKKRHARKYLNFEVKSIFAGATGRICIYIIT